MKILHMPYKPITKIGFLLLLIISFIPVKSQDTIKLMPLGNSITEGYIDGSLSPDMMRGYRYGLRYLLKNAGYKIDFVGSQSNGCAYFYDCQHAGIGGTRDQYLVRLLTDGYDERNDIQILVPPRFYLDEYDPDIILLHIGTNDIIHEGDAALTNQKITDILDMVDEYEARANKEVVVFVALIINRIKPWGTPAYQTTSFNNGIRTLVQNRIVAGDKLVIVDMENDAGFNYDATDMAVDGVHPNDMGYSKIAALWFSSIASNYNTPPVITEIPDQSFNEGESSTAILLDDYVSDLEDVDQNISWTSEQLGDANLNITINSNRQVVASPNDMEWSGSQTVVFKATDSGKNGKYIKFDTDTVVFTVIPVNDPPVITSTPLTSAIVGDQYSYTLTYTDIDSDPVYLSAIQKPAWLNFSETTGILAGTPEISNLGDFEIILNVDDGLADTSQTFTIHVNQYSGLDDINAAGFTIYPVPAHGYLMIESDKTNEETEIEVINLSGTILKRISLPEGEISYKLDLNGLRNGFYILKIVNKTTSNIIKVTVIN